MCVPTLNEWVLIGLKNKNSTFTSDRLVHVSVNSNVMFHMFESEGPKVCNTMLKCTLVFLFDWTNLSYIHVNVDF